MKRGKKIFGINASSTICNMRQGNNLNSTKGVPLQKCANAHAQVPNRNEGTCINDMNTEKHAWINIGYSTHQ